MALGKPVIANKGGGTNELVLDRESGFLITPQSPKELSEKILNLLENYGKRQKMGKAGVKRIKNEFCLDRMTDQFVKYYNKMV
jgi:glycosyltransferase involved in cell wall biosynthesis